MSLGRDQFILALAAIRTGTGNRRALRRQVANLVNAGNEWLARFDAQQNAAPQSFADSRPAALNTLLDAQPEVTIPTADPDDAVP